jgi:hypothetical protein
MPCDWRKPRTAFVVLGLFLTAEHFRDDKDQNRAAQSAAHQ